MACKTWVGQTFQREDPPGSGSGWTTADLTIALGLTLTFRNSYTVGGVGDDCTATFDWYAREDNGPWSLQGTSKNVLPSTTREIDLAAFDTPGAVVDVQVRTTYDGAVHTSDTITVTVSATAGEVDADLQGTTVTAGLQADTATADLPQDTATAGLEPETADADLRRDTATAGLR